MRLHTTTVLSLSTFTALALAGCSSGSTSSPDPASSASATTHQEGENGSAPAPLSSAVLSKRLLDESDLGEGYTRQPERRERHEDVTVIGCPALESLGGDAARGGSLDFPRKSKASFTYNGGSNAEVAEELYSDTAAKLSKSIGEIFDAMVVSCPTYQVASGSTVIDVSAAETTAPNLGDEQWSLLITYSVGGRRSVVKQTAVRVGDLLVSVSGSPALVDACLAKAVGKAHRAG